MDTSKILTILCCFILIVCLTFCITALVVLRNAVDESGTVQSRATELVQQLNSCMEVMKNMNGTGDSVQVSTNTAQSEKLTFCVRESNGKIGIYTADGLLLKVLDVAVETLPEADREALKNGITVASWQELISLIQDFTS